MLAPIIAALLAALVAPNLVAPNLVAPNLVAFLGRRATPLAPKWPTTSGAAHPSSAHTLADSLCDLLAPHAACAHPLLWAIGPGPARGMRAHLRAHLRRLRRPAHARAPPGQARPPAPHHHRQSGRQAQSADDLHRNPSSLNCD